VLHKDKAFAEKESRRWLDGAERAADLLASGAACANVVADREGDIYEDFACKPKSLFRNFIRDYRAFLA